MLFVRAEKSGQLRVLQTAGIGMKLGNVSHGSGRVVAATLSGSAAEAAGLRIGDVVLSVDGTPASRLGTDSMKSYLRGPEGSAVDLEVHRAASVRPLLRARCSWHGTECAACLQQHACRSVGPESPCLAAIAGMSTLEQHYGGEREY